MSSGLSQGHEFALVDEYPQGDSSRAAALNEPSSTAGTRRDGEPGPIGAASGVRSLPPTKGRLRDALPWWFGPGNEPLALMDTLDAPGLGELYGDIESIIAWLRYAQAAVAERIVDESLRMAGREPVELHGAGSGMDVREYATSTVTEEVKLLTGVPEWEARSRVMFATAPPAATQRLAEAMRAGTCSWERARYVCDKSDGLDSTGVDGVAEAALRPPRQGEVVSWRAFTDRVRRAVDKVTSTRRRRARAKAGRCAYVQLHEHGMGRFVIDGEGARVVAAFERVDTQARRMRRNGDERTLAQLRSDIALDFILNGELSEFAGAIPPGRVAVTVSLASSTSLTDAAGRTRFGDLPAEMVRLVAMAEGSTLCRIVTDPVAGGVVDASTDSYQPTDRMRRFITARDRTCRAPGCEHAAERCDHDHGVNWPHGPTTARNLTAKH